MKKIIIYLLLILYPLDVFAYSSYIIPGGENIGIEIKTKGVLIVGFYKVNNRYNESIPELKTGDYITKVNGIEVNTINELITTIENKIVNDQVTLSVIRNNKEFNSILNTSKDNNIYKTGLYVKDTITGIGTLSYIDPGTSIFGALGHEIIESNTKKIVSINNGSIYKSTVTKIEKSKDGFPGEKKAKLDYNSILGIINQNNTNGVYGRFKSINKSNLIKVGESNDIKLGTAYIRTTLEDNITKEYEIRINKINSNQLTKNIYFEVIDQDLINKTGGIVQGMSGSPIIQDNMIIGAVTHVIIDKPLTGYGIFITTMLNEGEN